MQDNLVYSRLLDLATDGTYRQIDVDRTSSVETDRGHWETDASGEFLLHPAADGLRFRALTAGPLTVVLDRPGTMAALPSLAAEIRRFLGETGDAVFARSGIAQIQTALPADAPADVLSIDPSAETFTRSDLFSLAHRIDDLLWSERTNTYILSPVTHTSPQLLILGDALFQARDLPRVRQEYHVRNGEAPPFYFARTGLKAFARRAGRWKVLPIPGWAD